MGRHYRPKRANKRWLEEAPPYVFDIFDAGDAVCDRYTVMIYDDTGRQALIDKGSHPNPGNVYVDYLAMSEKPTHPQGFSQWGEMTAGGAASFRYGYKHRRRRWLDLPENIREHVVARAKEGYSL